MNATKLIEAIATLGKGNDDHKSRLVRNLIKASGVSVFFLSVLDFLGSKLSLPICTLALAPFSYFLLSRLSRRWLGRVYKRLVAIGLIQGVVYAASFFWESQRGIPARFPKDSIGILIAQVHDDRGIVRKRLTQRLRADLAAAPDHSDLIQIKYLDRELPEDPTEEHEAALAYGRKTAATLVVRAVPIGDSYQFWITFIDTPGFPKSEANGGLYTEAQLAEIQLPGDIALLARCALAFRHQCARRWDIAATQLEAILKSPHLPDAAPSKARLYYMLGRSYLNSADRDYARLTPAISSFDSGISSLAVESQPSERAILLMGRAQAYWKLPGPVRNDNIREALSSVDGVLESYRTNSSALMYAKAAQLKALILLEQGTDASEAMRLAEVAALSFDRSKYPIDWAAATNTVAMALTRMVENRHENTLAAIRMYDDVAQVFSDHGRIAEWATAMNNRGVAYVQLGGNDRIAELQMAIQSYSQALKIRTRSERPFEFAASEINLGIAYLELGRTSGLAEFGGARDAFEAAAGVLDHINTPLPWAMAITGWARACVEANSQPCTLDLKHLLPSLPRAISLLSAGPTDQELKTRTLGLGQLLTDVRIRTVRRPKMQHAAVR